jgi:CO/xanthine dehydrogenase Mo-binding subunit
MAEEAIVIRAESAGVATCRGGGIDIVGVAAAIANAIGDAIGVRIMRLPPERMLTALQAKK